ncbi:MAG: zinc-binding dehydrogenase [Chloroflexi bacterium]|nr:MAG: zinc-binding dehydrogenase [Chloroflexota bacterium]
MAPNHLGSTDHSITLRHLANSGWNSSNLEPPVVAVSARLVRWVGSEWDRISSSRLAPGQGGISPHSSRHQARRWRMSGLSRYIVDAVVLERRSPTALAREDGITRRWIHKLVKRFKEGGYSALEPRSRRPHSCSHQISSDVQAKVLRLRQELAAAGHDASPETIAHHLIGQVNKVPSAATVWRILKRNGLITPQPHKRPKSSFIPFEAKLPNETFVTVKAADPVHVFHSASNEFGFPASLLGDNAAVFTAGRIVVVGFTAGRLQAVAANHLLIKNYSVLGLHWGLYRQRAPQLVPECTGKLLELYAEGKIRPHIGRQAPLEDAVTLFRAAASRQTTGKAVLTL